MFMVDIDENIIKRYIENQEKRSYREIITKVPITKSQNIVYEEIGFFKINKMSLGKYSGTVQLVVKIPTHFFHVSFWFSQEYASVLDKITFLIQCEQSIKKKKINNGDDVITTKMARIK